MAVIRIYFSFVCSDRTFSRADLRNPFPMQCSEPSEARHARPEPDHDRVFRNIHIFGRNYRAKKIVSLRDGRWCVYSEPLNLSVDFLVSTRLPVHFAQSYVTNHCFIIRCGVSKQPCKQWPFVLLYILVQQYLRVGMAIWTHLNVSPSLPEHKWTEPDFSCEQNRIEPEVFLALFWICPVAYLIV